MRHRRNRHSSDTPPPVTSDGGLGPSLAPPFGRIFPAVKEMFPTTDYASASGMLIFEIGANRHG